MTRGYRNNNPLNIRLSGGPRWRGEVRPSKDVSFCTFEDMAHGYRAAFKLLDNYRKNHGCDNLTDFITRWAPPYENNTRQYIDVVARRCHIADTTKIDTANGELMQKVVAAMSFMENGEEPDMEDIIKGWELFKIP